MLLVSTSTYSSMSPHEIEQTRKFVQEERRRIARMTPEEARQYLVDIKVVTRKEARRRGWAVSPAKKGAAAQ